MKGLIQIATDLRRKAKSLTDDREQRLLGDWLLEQADHVDEVRKVVGERLQKAGRK